MAAHAIWKGSISFGLVNIPIQVFSATQREDYTSFNQLCDKGHKIRYKKWCPVLIFEDNAPPIGLSLFIIIILYFRARLLRRDPLSCYSAEKIEGEEG